MKVWQTDQTTVRCTDGWTVNIKHFQEFGGGWLASKHFSYRNIHSSWTKMYIRIVVKCIHFFLSKELLFIFFSFLFSLKYHVYPLSFFSNCPLLNCQHFWWISFQSNKPKNLVTRTLINSCKNWNFYSLIWLNTKFMHPYKTLHLKRESTKFRKLHLQFFTPLVSVRTHCRLL